MNAQNIVNDTAVKHAKLGKESDNGLYQCVIMVYCTTSQPFLSKGG